MKIIKFSNLTLKIFKANNNEVVSDDGSRANKIIVNLFKNNKFRNSTCMPNIKATKELIFLTPNTKKAFNY